jgi:hypothetical protein
MIVEHMSVHMALIGSSGPQLIRCLERYLPAKIPSAGQFQVGPWGQVPITNHA